MAEKKEAKARALVSFEFGGKSYAPDDLVTLPGAELEKLKAAGLVDDNKAAVTYAESLTAGG